MSIDAVGSSGGEVGGREQLRLALVMNGGVSLAVWMGGVTNEIFRLVKASHPVYRGLLSMTRTDARVDVISGTSAGGVNGAALTVALLYGGDFGSLRRVWLETGALADLLRPALGKNPGSLLDGDGFFLPHIEQAFAELANGNSRKTSPVDMPIDLRLTTTLLTGRPGNTVDDLGVAVNDKDYRAYFQFRHTETKNDFEDWGKVLPLLARAARSTASFPFAFEPSLVPGTGEPDEFLKDAFGKPLKTPRFVVDGGLLNNKPFRGALQAIFGMPRRGSVRRVLAYVNPDPGDGTPPGKLGETCPPLSSVLSESILGIPQSQSIADQLQEIQDHNDAIRARRDSVVTLVRSLGGRPRELDSLAKSLFGVYRSRRLSSTFEIFVYQPLPEAAARHPELAGALRSIGKYGREQLKSLFTNIDFVDWIPPRWPASADAPEYRRDTWGWGLFPVEFGAKVMLDLLRRAQSLADYASFTPGAQEEAPTPTNGSLSLLWSAAYELVRELTRLRNDEQTRDWDVNTDALLRALNGKPDGGPARPAGVLTEADFRAMFAFLGTAERRHACADIGYAIAEVIRQGSRVALSNVESAVASGRLRASDVEQALSLKDLANFFRGDAPPGDQASQRQVLFKLMQLEVAEFSFNDHDRLNSDSVIELVQVSGNAGSPVGGECLAQKKLLGLQLGHFGAFYKRSWRANDWTFGRLDGAERLVKILLNPERLHRFYFTQSRTGADAAFRQIEDIALNSVEDQALKGELSRIWGDKGYEQAMRDELAFLDDLEARLPDALPACAAAITLRLHFDILLEELPELLAAIASDQSEGADNAGAGAAMLLRFGMSSSAAASGQKPLPVTPGAARISLEGGLIASERLIDEAGSDLFTRTLAHTIATLQGLLSSKTAKLGPVSLFFATLKLPIMGFYFVARGLTHQSRTSAALHGGILAAGVALVALQFTEPPSYFVQKDGASAHGTLAAFAWALLAYGLLMSIMRLPRTVGVLALVLLSGGVAYHYLPSSQPREIAIVAGFVLALVVFVASAWFPALQWLLGFAVIGFAACWTSGELAVDGARTTEVGIWTMAVLICLALLLALWQASPTSSRVERRVRAEISKVIARRKNRGAAAGAQCDGDAPTRG